MRPVVLPPGPPRDEVGAIPDWDARRHREHLCQQFGDYCFYCGVPLPGGAHREHAVPASQRAATDADRDVRLLACPTCNGRKGDTAVLTWDGHWWPHLDNILCYIEVDEAGVARCRSDLDDEAARRTNNSLDLVGLAPIDPAARRDDCRCRWHRGTFQMASRYRATPLPTDLIESRGCFHIWAAVLAGRPDLLQDLVAIFPGTWPDTFDATGQPQPRPRPARAQP